MPKAAPRRSTTERESSAKRGYGYKWQQAREGYLRNHPLCVDHMRRGRVVQATVVDHIEPHRGDMVLFWNKDNWQSLCADCHNIHKQRLEKSGRVQGCDVLGVPDDPNHHWHQR
jgi:5-methylcytosine-specific restriction enzyme A